MSDSCDIRESSSQCSDELEVTVVKSNVRTSRPTSTPTNCHRWREQHPGTLVGQNISVNINVINCSNNCTCELGLKDSFCHVDHTHTSVECRLWHHDYDDDDVMTLDVTVKSRITVVIATQSRTPTTSCTITI